MKAIMNLKALKNTEELQTFLDGTQAVAFSVPGDKKARYDFIQSSLIDSTPISKRLKTYGLLF